MLSLRRDIGLSAKRVPSSIPWWPYRWSEAAYLLQPVRLIGPSTGTAMPGRQIWRMMRCRRFEGRKL